MEKRSVSDCTACGIGGSLRRKALTTLADCYRVAFEGKYVAAQGRLRPETRLPLTVIGSAILPVSQHTENPFNSMADIQQVSIFWFAWTANRTHWINPVLAASFFGVGIDFVSFQFSA